MSLDVKVTFANEVESPQAKSLLKGAKNKHPDIKIDISAMDAAYDNCEYYRFIIKEIGAAPIIALNHGYRINVITEGSL